MADHHNHGAAQVACPSCDFGPFQRNAYWTGKLMLAGDFIAEQHYFMEKLRHHNAHLHGSGVVCGLKVVAHDKDECRNRFICVEPGTAIDCCGHEIVVRFKECIDLDTIPAVKALKDKNDDAKHKLVVCIRFRECETEQVPVLYDECGCHDEKCAPNRVLEAFELDVMIDSKPPEHAPFPEKCGDLWRTSVAGCPHCDTPDCVVLATITDYVVGNKIVDVPKPPDPVPAGSVAIDNFTERQILPSAQLIKEVIDCMLKQGPGGAGGAGPQGPPGPGIDAVQATFVDCDKPGDANIQDIAGKRTLVLQVPKGCDGKDGLEADLTQIVALSWHHGAGTGIHLAPDPLPSIIMIDGSRRRGFIIGFSKTIDVKSVDADHVFQVLIDDLADNAGLGLRCRCPLIGEVIAVDVDPAELKAGFITQAKETSNQQTLAVAFLLPKGFPGHLPSALQHLIDGDRPEFWVVLRCDFVMDKDKRAVDGEFVRAQLPTGDRPAGSAHGIQGGTFESWFQIQRQG